MDKIGHFLGDKYRDIAKGFMTVLKESKFYEEGVLTPEEFVKAGNYLTSKCPTWKWCSNKKNISPSDYLPKEKQFLQTTVPCILRVKDFDNKSKYSEKMVEDDWCETNFDYIKNSNKVKEFNDKELNYDENSNNNSNNKTNIVINEDYLDGIEIITNDLKIDKKKMNLWLLMLMIILIKSSKVELTMLLLLMIFITEFQDCGSLDIQKMVIL